MATVWIPALMRDLTGGEATVAAGGRNVRQVLDELEAKYPGVKERLCSGDRLKPSIRVAVDGTVSRLGLLQTVGDQSEVHFLPAVAGGLAAPHPLPLSHDGERGVRRSSVVSLLPLAPEWERGLGGEG